MTIKWFEGFETGDALGMDTEAGMPDTGTIETAVTSKSSYAWRMNVTDGRQAVEWRSEKDPWWSDGAGGGWIMFQIYITTLPGAGEYYYIFYLSTNNVTRYSGRITSTGEIELKAQAGSFVAATGTLETGKWYTVSIKSFSGQAAKIRVSDRDSGTNVIDHTATFNGTDFGGGVNPRHGIGPDGMRFGAGNNSTGNAVFDNIVYDDADDPYLTLGDNYTIEALKPNAAGPNDSWTGDYTDVDDIPHDGTATERTRTTLGSFTQECEDSSALSYGIESIESVMSYVYAKTNVALSNYAFSCLMREGGTTARSSDYNIGDPGLTDYTQGFSFIRNTSPDGSAWTPSVLDIALVGARRTSSGLGRTCSVTAASLHALYTVTSAGGNRMLLSM